MKMVIIKKVRERKDEKEDTEEDVKNQNIKMATMNGVINLTNLVIINQTIIDHTIIIMVNIDTTIVDMVITTVPKEITAFAVIVTWIVMAGTDIAILVKMA